MSVNQYPLSELKQVYRLLHQLIPTNPDLVDSQFLHDLQAHLQQSATKAGIDVSLHADWSSWLNDETDLPGE